jgi:type II secretory pathway component PulF
MVLVHASLWITLSLIMILVVPGYTSRFKNFDMQLPSLTESVLAVSNWFVDYFWILPFAFIPLLALDGMLVFRWYQQPSTRKLSYLWSGLMIALPVLASVVVVIGLRLAVVKFEEGLSR